MTYMLLLNCALKLVEKIIVKLLWFMARTSCNEPLIWCAAVGCKTGPDQNVEDHERCIAIRIN